MLGGGGVEEHVCEWVPVMLWCRAKWSEWCAANCKHRQSVITKIIWCVKISPLY